MWQIPNNDIAMAKKKQKNKKKTCTDSLGYSSSNIRESKIFADSTPRQTP